MHRRYKVEAHSRTAPARRAPYDGSLRRRRAHPSNAGHLECLMSEQITAMTETLTNTKAAFWLGRRSARPRRPMSRYRYDVFAGDISIERGRAGLSRGCTARAICWIHRSDAL